MKTNIVKLIGLEIKKTKRRGILLTILALWILQSIYLTYAVNDKKGFEQGYIMLLYQLPLLNTILLPTFCAVLSGRIIDLEHKGNTWKLLETIQSKKSIFIGKILFGLLCLTISCTLQLISAFIIGFFYEFKGTLDISLYMRYFFFTLTVSFILYLIQCILSFIFQNQAVSFCVGLCGSMIGLFICFFPRSIIYEIIPWGLYAASSFIGMNWDSETRITDFYYSGTMTNIEFILLLWIIILLFIGNKLFSKMDNDNLSIPQISLSKKTNYDTHITFSKLPPEYIKLKRTPIWIAFLAVPSISAVIGTFNYLGNISILNDLWYSLWSQHTLFLCYFFMPPLAGIYCSYLWKMEHNGTNWNQLMVNTSVWKIVADKLIVSCVMMFLTMTWIFILYIICGKYAGFTQPLPTQLTEWFICGFAGGIAICAAQCFLSLIIRSFALPIGIALIGGIAGLMFTSKGMWYLVPYSLLSLGMRANNPFREIEYVPFFMTCALFTISFYLLSIFYINKAMR